jgi:hypothetical protein
VRAGVSLAGAGSVIATTRPSAPYAVWLANVLPVTATVRALATVRPDSSYCSTTAPISSVTRHMRAFRLAVMPSAGGAPP